MFFKHSLKILTACLFLTFLLSCVPASPVVQADEKVAEPSVQPVTEPTTIVPSSVPVTTAPTTAIENREKDATIPPTGAPEAVTGSTRVFLPEVTLTRPPAPPPPAGDIVVDYTSVAQFEQIPDSVINQASALRVMMLHKSVGEGVRNQLDYLQGTRVGSPYPQYKYDRRLWNWQFYPTAFDFGTKINEFKQVVGNSITSYDIFGMKLCFLDTWAQASPDLPLSETVKFPAYRDMMLALEAQHPDKKFVWTTQALWADNSPEGNGAVGLGTENYNKLVRQYALEHNKIFFDLASIESHSEDGSVCYSGYEALCTKYAGDAVGHPSEAGALRIAKGFWVLMAKIAGWKP